LSHFPSADLVLLNGKIFTADKNNPWAEAAAVFNGRFCSVGSSQNVSPLIGEKTTVLDLNGRLAVPGFNDAHTHFMDGGFYLRGVDLREAHDEREFISIIEQKSRELPAGTWITGGCWDHEVWPSNRYPTKTLIDAATTHHPVLVSRLDMHVSCANSLALQIAGIDKNTPNPPGGYIEKDSESGEPTGIVKDTAQELVRRAIPERTKEEYRAAAKTAMAHAAEYGVTSVQDNTAAIDLKIYNELLASGELTTRIYAWRGVDFLEQFTELGITAPFGNSMLRLGCIKIFADGSVGARTACFFDPYKNDAINSGLLIHQPDTLKEHIEKTDAAGLQLAVHAIGDKTNDLVLSIFEDIVRRNGKQNRRHRIEHAQVVRPADVARFAAAGLVVSPQPAGLIDDMRWAEKVIGDRIDFSFRIKSFLDAGVPLAFGTDWTVEPLNPIIGLYAAVTREFPEGGPEDGLNPEERISLEEALTCYTRGSAYAEFTEHDKGSIEIGKRADVAVLSQDLFSIPVSEYLNTKVDKTILGGKIIYQRN